MNRNATTQASPTYSEVDPKKSCGSRNRRKYIDRLISGVFFVAIGILVFKFYGLYAPTGAVDLERLGFGTGRSPYSDALYPWLHGTLSLYFTGEVPQGLYRPTVAILYSSILAIAPQIQWIPLALGFLFLAGTVSLYFVSERASRLLIIVTVLLFGLASGTMLARVSPHVLNVDLAALVFSTLGTLFLIVAFKSARMPLALASAGLLLIGLAAAIRGPMMFGGGVLLLLGVILLAFERRFLACGVLIASMLFPIALDAGIQKAAGIRSNGIQALYCVYSDPTHGWTPDCKSEYRNENPSAKVVIESYLNFIASAEGISALSENLDKRYRLDLRIFFLVPAMYVFALAGILGIITAQTPLQRCCTAAAGIVIVSLCFLGYEYRQLQTTLGTIVLFLILLFGSLGKRPLPAVLILAYLGCITFLGLLGVWSQARLAATCSFLLPLALFALFLLRTSISTSPVYNNARANWLGAATLATVAILYTATFLIPASRRAAFQGSVLGKQAAMKISSEKALDRALYLDGKMRLFYTRSDSLPVWSVRQYKKLIVPVAIGNQSFLEPIVFEE